MNFNFRFVIYDSIIENSLQILIEVKMSFTLPDLPYSHDSLDNLGMSKETLEFHHDLHHKACLLYTSDAADE